MEAFRKSLPIFSGGYSMFLSHARLAFLISAALLAPSAFASHVHRSPTSGQTSTSHKLTHTTRHRPSSHARGQQAIEPERVSQIQQALIREHYMSGDASGKWDASTISAMQKYQADHGWQTKIMPDSRALKGLGLGPDYSGALNAQGSNFGAPAAASGSSTASTHDAGFVAASGVKQ
jgi:peptidoglycan hydrolase-like protein with peptidoglycan-binding domain